MNEIWTGRDNDNNAFTVKVKPGTDTMVVWKFANNLLGLLGWSKISVIMKGDLLGAPLLNPND